MDYKEMWNERYEQVEEELGREPTSEEVRTLVELYIVDEMADLADALNDRS